MEQKLLEATETTQNLALFNKDLCSYFKVNKKLIKILSEGIELILENDALNEKEVLETCLRMAELGVDTVLLRKKIEFFISKVFIDDTIDISFYLNFLEFSLSKLAINFNKLIILFNDKIHPIFQSGKKIDKCFVYHSQFNFGEVLEINENQEVLIYFLSGEKKITMQFIMKQCSLYKKNSFINKFLQGERLKINEFNQQRISQKTYGSIIPITELSKTIFIHIMMPKYFKKATLFDQWFRREGKNIQEKQRLWKDSRSIAELVLNLKKEKIIHLTNEIMEKLMIILLKGTEKKNQAFLFAQCCILIWDKSNDKSKIKFILSGIKDKVIVWQDKKIFIDVCDKLNIAELNSWQMMTSLAVNKWQKEIVFDLPLRNWDAIQKALKSLKQDNELLIRAKDLAKKGLLSCDAIIFLWENYQKDLDKIKGVIDSPRVIFRALSKTDLSGNYIKAQKILKNLLLTDKGELFQRFILANGDSTMIKIFIDTAQSTSCFDEQEKQSLFVRIVRLYDKAKAIVEENVIIEVVEAKFSPITALVNYKKKQNELEKIIKDISKNTKDISIAREHGDLRENAEYKAAKEQQKYLLSRRSELEKILQDMQPTDFVDVKVKDRVIPGCQVELLVDLKIEIYVILGLLDSEPTKKYISFDTPLSSLLLGKNIGDKIILPNKKKAIVKRIKPLSQDILSWAKGN